jgi:hypothetical protein
MREAHRDVYIKGLVYIIVYIIPSLFTLNKENIKTRYA